MLILLYYFLILLNTKLILVEFITMKNIVSIKTCQYIHDLDFIVKKNDTEILSAIGNRNINLRDTVLLNESLPITLQQGSGSAKFISSDLNSQRFQINSTKPGLFYISDTFYPDWEAVLNNKSSKIYQANYN